MKKASAMLKPGSTSKNLLISQLVILAISVVGTQSLASSRADLDYKAGLYLLNSLQSQSLDRDSRNPQCPDPGKPNQDCSDFVAGSFPNQNEKIEAVRACVGVTDMNCVKWASGSFPNFQERVDAARACRNSNLACAEYVAGSFPNTVERIQSANACQNSDLNCVKHIIGSFPSFNEKIQAAKACAGN